MAARQAFRLADPGWFVELAGLHGYSLRRLARAAGCDHAHLVRIVAGRRNASAGLAGSVCAVLRVRPSAVWVPVERSR